MGFLAALAKKNQSDWNGFFDLAVLCEMNPNKEKSIYFNADKGIFKTARAIQIVVVFEGFLAKRKSWFVYSSTLRIFFIIPMNVVRSPR